MYRFIKASEEADIYPFKDDALVLCYQSYPDAYGEFDFDDMNDMDYIGDVDGKSARKEIEDEIAGGCEPVFYDGYIIGYYKNGDAFTYAEDQDGMTYEDEYGEPFSS